MRFHGLPISFTRFAIFAGAVFAVACSSGSSKSVAPGNSTTALRGVVTSTLGDPLAQVKISAGNVSASSDESGRYELRAPAGKAHVRFSLSGHVDGFRSPTLLDGSPTQLDIALLPLAAAIPLDTAAGGTVMGMRGAAVKVPADAFVDSSGEPVSGMVDVYLTPLDPSRAAERGAAPEFIADMAGQPALLESFGMLEVSVRKADQKLNLAPGKELELSIPVPEGATPEVTTMDVWSFDEAKSAWVNEGKAQYDAATKTYVAAAQHMSLWNVDQVYTASCVCGLVVELGGGVLAGARATADGVSYLGTSETHTDRAGKFCLAVRKDSEIEVAAYHASSGGQSKRIHSGSEDTDVPAKIGDPRCVDAGRWEVKKDVFVDSSGGSTRCGDVSNPFANGCAADLGSVFGSCYKPEGECTLSYQGSSSTTRYSNGCYSEGDISGTRFYSMSGKLCATMSVDAASVDAVSVRYTLPDKREFTLTVGASGSGDYVFKCPNGQETRVTPAQRAALEACSSPEAANADAAQCKVEGSSVPDGGAGIPTTCTKDADCNTGTVCCTIPNDTTKVCFADSICKLLQQQ
jgi:hypothetical protein